MKKKYSMFMAFIVAVTFSSVINAGNVRPVNEKPVFDHAEAMLNAGFASEEDIPVMEFPEDFNWDEVTWFEDGSFLRRPTENLSDYLTSLGEFDYSDSHISEEEICGHEGAVGPCLQNHMIIPNSCAIICTRTFICFQKCENVFLGLLEYVHTLGGWQLYGVVYRYDNYGVWRPFYHYKATCVKCSFIEDMYVPV